LTKKQLLKIAALNGFIVIVNILLLSEGFLNLLSSDNIILKAIGIAVIVMSVLLFGYGNYSLLKPQETKIYKNSDLLTGDDYIDALENCPNQKIFRNELDKGIKQMEKIRKKSELLKVILLQYFTEGEMTYHRFQNVIAGVESVFFRNIKKVINRITIFDAQTYKEQKKGQDVSADYDICGQHIEYINQSLIQNDLLLRKVDDLILEVSKLDEMKESALEELPAIQEIDQLIEETKYYQ